MRNISFEEVKAVSGAGGGAGSVVGGRPFDPTGTSDFWGTIGGIVGGVLGEWGGGPIGAMGGTTFGHAAGSVVQGVTQWPNTAANSGSAASAGNGSISTTPYAYIPGYPNSPYIPIYSAPGGSSGSSWAAGEYH